MKTSDLLRASTSKCTHSFHPRKGYVDHEEMLPVPPGSSAKPCLPAKKTKDGSLHRLKHTPSGTVMEFSWVAAEGAWERMGGNRMAWRAEYMAAHGWKYGGRVT